MITLFLDACAIIYWVEITTPQYQQFANKLHSINEKYGRTSFSASQLSLLECRIKPLRDENKEVLNRYHTFFTASDLNLIPLDQAVIEHATLLRVRYNLATPDALQAASAFSIKDQLIFITADKVFKKIPDLKVEFI